MLDGLATTAISGITCSILRTRRITITTTRERVNMRALVDAEAREFRAPITSSPLRQTLPAGNARKAPTQYDHYF